MTAVRSAWFRCFRPQPAATGRVICFPHAGGSASFYFPLAAMLDPDIEVQAVQYPGRQDRFSEPGLTSVAELSDQIAEALTAAGLADLPLCFFGHSMGAVLAFEVARRCRTAGPRALLVSGRRSPTTVRVETAHTRDDAGLLADVAELGGSDLAALENPELLRLILPALRSDYTAIETYRHDGSQVDVPIIALTGTDDQRTTTAEAEAWSEVTTADFTLHHYPGGHFFLTDQLDSVADLVRSSLGVAAN